MKYGLVLGKDGRILSVGIYHQGFPDDVEQVDVLPEGDYNDYLYLDGEYIYCPRQVETKPVSVSAEEQLAELSAAVERGLTT